MKLASLSDSERETVITWSDADGGVAVIYTCQPPMMRLLSRHPHARLVGEHRSTGGEIVGAEYEIPVACLALLLRPRPSAWERMMRTGPKGRRPRGRSLDSAVDAKNNHSGVAPAASSRSDD